MLGVELKMTMTLNEVVEIVIKKKLSKIKANFTHVYLPKDWEGREVLICLMPKKK